MLETALKSVPDLEYCRSLALEELDEINRKTLLIKMR
jgi:hypothetical protein